MINNLTSINLANLLRLMNCVSESLTICVRSFELWRRLRDLFEFSLLIAIFVGPASYIFILSSFADLAWVMCHTGLLCGCLFSPLLYGPDLWQSILVCGLHNPFCQCGQHCFLEHFAARQATCFWCLDDRPEKRSSESQTNTT